LLFVTHPSAPSSQDVKRDGFCADLVQVAEDSLHFLSFIRAIHQRHLPGRACQFRDTQTCQCRSKRKPFLRGSLGKRATPHTCHPSTFAQRAHQSRAAQLHCSCLCAYTRTQCSRQTECFHPQTVCIGGEFHLPQQETLWCRTSGFGFRASDSCLRL